MNLAVCKNRTMYTTVKMFGVNKIYYLKNKYFFIQQVCIKLFKNVKTFIKLKKIFVSHKCCSFDLFIQRIWGGGGVSGFPQNYEAAQLFSTLIIIRNVS